MPYYRAKKQNGKEFILEKRLDITTPTDFAEHVKAEQSRFGQYGYNEEHGYHWARSEGSDVTIGWYWVNDPVGES